MLPRAKAETVTSLDVSRLPYTERLCAAALQGLINRSGPKIYLDYGIYDDPDARRTNEVFFDDELWFGKYRSLLGNQDQRNLEEYRQRYQLTITKETDLIGFISKHRESISGLVIWDEDLPDTANIAVMLAGLEGLLPVTFSLAQQVGSLGLMVKEDLRGRWSDRVGLYQWAFDNLFRRCKSGVVACVEPEWQRPEFIDYLVQNQIFTYSLASGAKGAGHTLLMLLAFGPPIIRELIFGLRLDGCLRRYALRQMGKISGETALANRIQKAVKGEPYPTIFGWHTRRDDELSFMFQLSANGLRLVPSHLGGNYSFHSKLKASGIRQKSRRQAAELDPEGIYLTFTLSDGDQLMMMHTGELGNWYHPARGKVPFNWEVQPLLAELAPGLLEKYISSATENDCLVAGPSGAGYIVPPLAPHLAKYMDETDKICHQSGIQVVTSYVADPPRHTLRTLARHRGNLLGYLCGYAVVTRAPMHLIDGVPVIANRSPLVNEIVLQSNELLETVRQKITESNERPCFIGVHLFAYRTTIEDVVNFVNVLDIPHLHVVRGDEFLLLASQAMRRRKNGKE